MHKKLVSIGGVILGLIIIGGLSYYFARSGGGQIDVSQKITNTDQQGFSEVVRPDTRPVAPNGGLRPQGDAPAFEPPAPEPAPTDGATTTEETATSTDEADTEAEGEAEPVAE